MKELVSNVVAKSILDKEELKVRRDAGFKKIEVQLYTKDFFNVSDERIDFLVKDYAAHCNDVVTVHSPLPSDKDIYMGGEAVDVLDVLSNKNMQISLIETCKLAQGFAKYFNHRVGVVIHLGYSDISKSGSYYNPTGVNNTQVKLKIFYQKLLKDFPDIDFYIENVPTFRDEKEFFTTNKTDISTEPVYLAHLLNNLFSEQENKRFYTCLDTCHFMSNYKAYKKIAIPFPYTLDSIFDIYSSTCKNIHLSNLINYGFAHEEHGTGFQNDEVLLERFLNSIKQYMPNANIVLEMREKDYSNPENAIFVYNYIKN